MYTAFGGRDETALRRLLAPDVEWIQCAGFPGGAHRRGVESVLEGVLHGNNARWQDFRVEHDEFVVAGATVVVIGSYSGTHAETRKTMRAVFTHVYEVEDGQVRRFRQFCDTWPMVQAMSPA
ncbi:MAG: nuclear transport factor 2 family protein [Planctomycetes bacterium]|nr:nuclear transport factor 2 family protein [Planctomycetota bacterium]